MIRLANSSDTIKIESFYRHHSPKTLHPRSLPYVKSMIAKNAFILEENPRSGEMEACREFLALKTPHDIRSFLETYVPGFTLPYQENDVLVYFGGTVRKDGSNKEFIRRSNKLMEDLIGVNQWIESRKQWANTGILSLQNAFSKPSRLIFCFGTLGNDDRTWVNFVTQRVSHMLGGERASHCFARHGIAPSGVPGEMHFIVHDVPLNQHQKERTKRNRYLITESEQRRLFGSRIGFVGLSTGSVALEAFLREGIGGYIRIADHDIFETSNSNRMLFGVAEEGRSKVDICRKRIQEVDPSIVVEPFPMGVTKENIDEFVKNCDLIVEECDDFRMKVLVRLAARRHGIPLLMAASQNGMIDVERYDVDPNTKPFHLEDESALSVLVEKPDLSASEKNKLLSRLYDLRPVSSRFLGSGMEIGKSISSWPQLAEEVFLNAATLAHAARRILLGDDTVISGRFSIPMNDVFSPCTRIATHEKETVAVGLTSYPRDPYTMNPTELGHMKELFFVSYWARSAPSGGNQQPWTTRVIQDAADSRHPRIEIYFRKEAASYYNFEHVSQEGWIDIALGTMLFNAEVAAACLGKQIQTSEINTNIKANYAVAIRLATPEDDEAKRKVVDQSRLFNSLRHRTSSRSSPPMNRMPQKLKEKLVGLGVLIVEENVATTQAPSLDVVRSAIVDERAARLLDFKGVLAEVGGGKFQLHPKVLGLSDEEANSIDKLSNRPDVIDFVSSEGFLQNSMLEPFAKEMDETKVFMILTACSKKNDHVENGRLLELIWLEITWHGFGVRPFSLSQKQRQKLRVPNAFFVMSLVKPHNIPVCSSRL